MEFNRIHIFDLGKIVTGKTPKTSIKENYGGSIPFLTPSDDLCGKYIYKTKRTLTNKGLQEVKNCLLPSKSVSVSCIGSDLGKVVINKEPTVTNQQINSIVIDTERFDVDYIYYLMTIIGEKLNFLSKTSTAVPIINKSTFSNIEIDLPNLENQKKISAILSSLDNKIDLNRKINENLEQQAQALFKSWFVDFEPFKDGKFVESELGMIPEGWKDGTIGEYCKVRSGYAFKSSSWKDDGIEVIKIKNITNDGQLDMLGCSHVDIKDTVKAQEFKVNAGDLLIAMTGATIGKFCIIPKSKVDRFVNQRVGKFFIGERPIKRLPFIYEILKTEDVYKEIINRGQGSAQPNISGNDIESISIILPPDNIIDKYNIMMQPIYLKILSNIEENQILEEERDTLLPKLMSGEIELK